MSQEVMDRWRGFVAKVTLRMQEIMSEARSGFEAMLADPEVCPMAFGNAMNAIELRCKELRSKLPETYAEQVVLRLGASAAPAEALLRQTEWEMFERFERFRAYFNGQLTRQVWPRVQASMRRPVACTRCGATLERAVLHQAESIQCRHCAAVNGVSPEPIVYTYFALAPGFYAEEQTIEGKLALERAELSGASRQQLVSLARPHWDAYAKASSTILPMGAEEQQRFVESRLSMIRG